MPKSHVITTRKIASLRIHVERAIQRIKIYRMLSSVVPLSLSHIIEHVWGVCCACIYYMHNHFDVQSLYSLM